MSKGRALEGAPGWRVVERQRRSWPAGFVILPVAVLVGLLQILVPSASERLGWWQDRWTTPSDRSPLNAQAAIGGPQVDRQASAEGGDKRAGLQQARLPTRTPLPNNGAAEDTAKPDPGSTRVLIHHRTGTEGAVRALQLAAYLQARSFIVTDILAVDTQIEQPGVRYFFEGDRSDSQRLAEAIGAFFAKTADQAPHEAMDFSHFSPKPEHGHLEVWLPESRGDETS